MQASVSILTVVIRKCYGMAGMAVEDVIDPRETRAYLCRFIDAMQGRLASTLGPKAKYGVRP